MGIKSGEFELRPKSQEERSMQKLLIPIDSSDNATRALQHAIRLAKENGPVELHIVYAHEPPIVYGEIAIYMPEEKAKELQRQHSEDILKPAIEMANAAGVKFTSQILIGDIPKTIVKCAEDLGCDGIVMGTRGMGAIGNLLMGSVATKVIHLTKLPVTLVK
jgi:nucleotide-binding universal stress UspA family protein